MRKKQVNILFITEASLTGAPVLLSEIIKVIKDDPAYKITVLIKRHDALVNEFASVAKTYVLKGKLYFRQSPGILLRIGRAFVSMLNRVVVYPRLTGTDIIISNTIINGSILRELSFLNAKVICYVHELENVISTWKPRADVDWSLKLSHFFIVPSQAVKDNLVAKHSVSAERIRLFTTYLPAANNNVLSNRKQSRDSFCSKYSIDAANLLVAGMGTADERKGIDLFVEVANQLKHSNNITFVWIGRFANPGIETRIKAMVKQYGLEKKIVFTGALPRANDALLPFDLFFLSSREDPYPLVVLEAASLKIPSLCFEGSGGIGDFVNGNGWMIPNFSVPATADMIEHLYHHRPELEQAGNNAYNKFINMHHDRGQLVAQFNEAVSLALNSKV